MERDLHGIIEKKCNDLRCGMGCFKILSTRPLNHGQLVICRVWPCVYRRLVWESEYRFIISEDNKVHTLDYRRVSSYGFGPRIIGSCGRAKISVPPSEW